MIFEINSNNSSILDLAKTSGLTLDFLCNEKLFLQSVKNKKVNLNLDQVIEQLESIYIDTVTNIELENDIFFRDSFALLLAINFLKQFN